MYHLIEKESAVQFAAANWYFKKYVSSR